MEKKENSKNMHYLWKCYTHTVQGFYSQKKLENDNVLSFIYENDMNNALFLWFTLVVISLNSFSHARVPETGQAYNTFDSGWGITCEYGIEYI